MLKVSRLKAFNRYVMLTPMPTTLITQYLGYAMKSSMIVSVALFYNTGKSKNKIAKIFI